MKSFKPVKIGGIIVLSVFIVGLIVGQIIQVASAEPGTDSDPIVTQGYVDEKNKELTASVSELKTTVEALKQQLSNVQTKGVKFEAIEMTTGQQLIAGDSAEIILRGGRATAIASAAGGLSDITSGTGADIKTGASVPLNHLLLVSRDDGRGLKVVSAKAWLLVKGQYTIK